MNSLIPLEPEGSKIIKKKFLPELVDPVDGRRSRSGIIVRSLYSLSIICLSMYLLWSFGRQFIFLEGPGTLLAKKHSISLPYNGVIGNIYVVHGQRVNTNQILFDYSSSETQKQISDLLRAIADQLPRENELEVRIETAKATRSSAEKRLKVTNEAISRMEKLPFQMFSYQERFPFYREQNEAIKDVSLANAEINVNQISLERIRQIKKELIDQKNSIEISFNEGVVISNETGTIGSQVPSRGDPVIVAKPILEIYDMQDIYIDWEMPITRFVEPKLGDRVFITSGFNTYDGVITEIFPVAMQRDENEVTLIQPTPKGQIARVRSKYLYEHVNPENNPVINSIATIRMDYGNIINLIYSVSSHFRTSR